MVRVREQPVEQILAAGLTILPMAPVSRVERAKVPEILVAISERLERETTPEQAAILWNATTVLMGLHYSKDEIGGMIRGVYKMLFGIHGIEESSIYQDIFQKGEAKGAVQEARKILIRHGTKKFGPPGEQALAQIAALDHLDRLHDPVDGVFDVGTWDELLAPLSDPN